MTLCDVVGRFFRGFRKKGAVRLGLFLLWPPVDCNKMRPVAHVHVNETIREHANTVYAPDPECADVCLLSNL